MLRTLLALFLFLERLPSSNGNFLPQLAFSVSPQPILRLGESAQLICTTQYSMLHNAEIRDTSHNVTLVLKHDGVPLSLAAVVPSQVVSQTCYECVAKDHSGNLLAKDELCVEVMAKEDPVIAITRLVDSVTFDLSGSSCSFNTTLVAMVPEIGVNNVSAAFSLAPTSSIRMSLLELYHNATLDTKLALANGSVSFTIHFELESLKGILIRNITEILKWTISLYNYTNCVQTQIAVVVQRSIIGNGNEDNPANSQDDSTLSAVLGVTVTVILLSIIAIIVGIAIIARNLYLVRRYHKQCEVGLGAQPLMSAHHRPSRFRGRRASSDDHTTLTQLEEEGL